jgi:hypothetical protein
MNRENNSEMKKVVCYNMEVGENCVRVFYVTEKGEGERLEIYRRHQPLQP